MADLRSVLYQLGHDRMVLVDGANVFEIDFGFKMS